MLKPSLAILDETDSGLDIDALKVVARGVNKMRGPNFSALIITHYQRILTQIVPDYVHIMYKGRIVTSGGKDLVETLESRGYDWIKEQYGIEEEASERAVSSR
jgi:Fe-S cluster assembly ATP-binding protein